MVALFTWRAAQFGSDEIIRYQSSILKLTLNIPPQEGGHFFSSIVFLMEQ